MDNLKNFNLDPDSSKNNDGDAFVDGALEFQIYGSALEYDKKDEKAPDAKDGEFSIPDAFTVDDAYTSSSFVQTPSSIRPTYLPRFTEVSETYRMQNDPRPRQKTDTHFVKATANDDTVELDPTTEKLEEKEVKKIVVTSAVIKSSEPADETLTVLKFSSPDFEEKEEKKDEATTVTESKPVADVDDGLSDFVDDEVEELIVEAKAEEKPKNMTIPDPDPTFGVVEFAKKSVSTVVEPKGAYDNDKKTKGSRHGEFESSVQRDDIKDRFLDILMSVRVRLCGSLLLLLAMVAMDCLPYFGINVFEWIGLGAVPYAQAFIDMQFSICVFLFALPEVIRAFRSLAKGKFAPELFLVLSLAMVVANDLVIVNVKADDYLTFGVLYGFACLMTVIASYNRTVGDFTSFKLVSRNVAKNVLDKRLTRELPRENLALDGVVDEYNSKTARMFRTVFVSNFFKRVSKTCENSVNTVIMMGIGLGISVVSGVVVFLLGGYSPVLGTQTATFVLMLALPVFSILVHKLPYKHACKNAAKEESAFVGESSIYDGADVDVFAYDDTEIFGIEDVSLRKVHLYGKVYNTPKAMQQMYALFSVVGGPLDFVFSSALDRKCSSATDVVIEDNGVSGVLEGNKICAGTEEYMRAHGIAIPEDDYRTNPLSTDSTKVMYGAEDGEVYVKFFIRYSFSEEFTMLLPELKDKKIVPLIYTRDPNITTDLLKILTLGEDIIRVMKKYTPRSSEEKTYRRIDSGIVTHGDKNSAVNMVLLAKRYAAFQSSLASTELISMIVGAVLAVVLAIGDMLVLPTTLLALWQVVWCVVLCIRSKRYFRHRSDREDESNEQ